MEEPQRPRRRHEDRVKVSVRRLIGKPVPSMSRAHRKNNLTIWPIIIGCVLRDENIMRSAAPNHFQQIKAARRDSIDPRSSISSSMNCCCGSRTYFLYSLRSDSDRVFVRSLVRLYEGRPTTEHCVCAEAKIQYTQSQSAAGNEIKLLHAHNQFASIATLYMMYVLLTHCQVRNWNSGDRRQLVRFPFDCYFPYFGANFPNRILATNQTH